MAEESQLMKRDGNRNNEVTPTPTRGEREREEQTKKRKAEETNRILTVPLHQWTPPDIPNRP